MLRERERIRTLLEDLIRAGVTFGYIPDKDHFKASFHIDGRFHGYHERTVMKLLYVIVKKHPELLHGTKTLSRETEDRR